MSCHSSAADLEEALKKRRAEGQNSGNAGTDGMSSAVNELANLLVQTEKETGKEMVVQSASKLAKQWEQDLESLLSEHTCVQHTLAQL